MSKIEWTGETWNPVAGCSIVSPGCTHCYAMRQAARIERMIPSLEHYCGLTMPSKAGPIWTGKVALAPEKTLLEPLRRRKPTTYFVNSMSDLFHESVPNEWIDHIFAVMALRPQHKFQVLTKRPARMREYINRSNGWLPDGVISFMVGISGKNDAWRPAWPLSNVWLGTSCERQKEADERIPHLLATPAAVRFISAEPLLGPVELRDIDDGVNSLRRRTGARLDWVIVGGESGPDARPMHPDWARSIRDQCQAAGVAFFFKQWGQWGPSEDHPHAPEELPWFRAGEHETNCQGMSCVGKKAAGRLLDGRTWDEMPKREPVTT